MKGIKEKFESNIISEERDIPVLVDFYATWCGPCKQLEGELELVANKLQSKVKVFKADIDKHLQTALKYKVRGVPALILFNNGREIWRHNGFIDAESLEKQIAEAIESAT